MQRLTCKQLVEFLDDYVEGALRSEVRVEFERHVSICKHCADYLRTYRQTIQLSRSAYDSDDDARVMKVPEDLIAAVINASMS